MRMDIPPPLPPMQDYRLRRHLSQDAVAAAAGIAQARISRIERGAIDPSPDEALRIAQALEVPVRLLWPELDANAPEGPTVDRSAEYAQPGPEAA